VAGLVEPRAAGVALGRTAEVLGRIAEPGQAAAIWTRRRDPGLARWLDDLPEAQLPAIRQACTVRHAGMVAAAACAAAGLANGAGRQLLCEDVATLARLLGRIMAVEALHLRLEVVRDDACRKFHLDRVTARLLCSYRGAGTEYGRAPAGGAPTEIRHMATGDVGIFRGSLWPGDAPACLVHRSPPLSGGGGVRLLLVLDPLEAGHG
jgi:hypothetical protein